MKVKVKFFSVHREIIGKNEIVIDVKEGSTINNIFEILKRDYPGLARVEKYTIISLNHNYAVSNEKLKEGDEIALFPPVGGG